MLITTLTGLIVLAAIAHLSVNVVRDLKLLNAARSDNVQWTLSQAEVEFLEYKQELMRAASSAEPNLKRLRREFDIFYSRINTLSTSTLYAALRAEPAFGQHLDEVQKYIRSAVQSIDASDPVLVSSLPDLLQATTAQRPNVRALSNSGLTYFARYEDRRRNSVSRTLLQLASAGALLLLMLLFMICYLSSLNRLNVRRRHEAKEAAKRMEIVIATALDAVIVSDDHGIILEFNAAAEQIFGYTAEQVLGQKMGPLIIPDKYVEAHEAGLLRMRETGEKRVTGKGRIQMEAKRANGELFPAEFAIQSAETWRGTLFIAFMRDISLRRKAEDELVATRDQALANERAKTKFLATMSHEIRTPLNGLMGNLTLLKDTRLNPRQARYIKNMETSGELLMRHVTDVLDITKYDAGKLELRPIKMNLSKLLQDIVDNQSGAASATGTMLEWQWIGTPTNWIYADLDRVQHILMNIVGNAVKFTRQGRVSIEVQTRDTGDGKSELSVSVRDTGIGIDPELQAHVFEDFKTGDSSYMREVGGTGLGLGIAKRFVEAMGGVIGVESEKGKGSHFWIKFPVEIIEGHEMSVAKPKGPVSGIRANILLVEDNQINREVAREMLTIAGHTVTEAADGRAAVDLAARTRFDLIFMDISMPVMDGRAATRAIRGGNGKSARAPIVALTANAMASEQMAFLADGMNSILMKPLSRETMMRTVSDLVENAEAEEDAEAEPAAQPTGVDSTYVNELREALGAERVNELLARFAAEMQELLVSLKDAGTSDIEVIRQRVHKIAGSAATLGARDVHSVLVAIEDAAKAADRETVVELCEGLQEVWEITRPALMAPPPQ